MSLIDEALKRAQAAHQAETRPSGDARPWTPAPLPDRSEARRAAAWRTGGLVALSLAVIAAAWLLRPASKTAAVPEGPARRPAVAAQPTPFQEVIVAPPSRGVPAEPTRASAAAARPARPQAAGAVASVSPSAEAPAGDAPGRPAPAASRLVNGQTYVGSISLPGGARIELGGIVYSDSNATALVNGRPLGTGSYVEGFSIVKIEPGRVELEGNGLTIYLALGK